jgi:Tol biopolymer transport system component
MGMRRCLAMLGVLPLLVVGSGAVAGAGAAPENGLIAARGADAIYLVDTDSAKAWKVPGSEEMSEPAWSPDGSLLAVGMWDDSGDSVYTVRPDGSDRRLVLENAWSPSWSPDGKRLVVVRDSCFAPYTCGADTEGMNILVSVRVDGSDAHQLTFDHGNESANANTPAWSPDGKWIAYVGGEGAVELVASDGHDGGVRTVADSGSSPAWSPDASKLAFDIVDASKDYKQEIVVLDLATGLRTKLPSRPTPVSALAWSPDGKQLAFLSSRTPMPQSGHCGGEMTMDLWGMDTKGTNPHLLSNGSYGRPAWGTFQSPPKPSD